MAVTRLPWPWRPLSWPTRPVPQARSEIKWLPEGLSSEPSYVESSVHVKHLAGAERKQLLNQRTYGFAYILRRAPTLNRSKSILDQVIVLLSNRSGHIAGD